MRFSHRAPATVIAVLLRIRDGSRDGARRGARGGQRGDRLGRAVGDHRIDAELTHQLQVRRIVDGPDVDLVARAGAPARRSRGRGAAGRWRAGDRDAGRQHGRCGGGSARRRSAARSAASAPGRVTRCSADFGEAHHGHRARRAAGARPAEAGQRLDERAFDPAARSGSDAWSRRAAGPAAGVVQQARAVPSNVRTGRGSPPCQEPKSSRCSSASRLRRHRPPAVRGALEGAVVDADELAVAGQPDVALDAVGARPRSPARRRPGCAREARPTRRGGR